MPIVAMDQQLQSNSYFAFFEDLINFYYAKEDLSDSFKLRKCVVRNRNIRG